MLQNLLKDVVKVLKRARIRHVLIDECGIEKWTGRLRPVSELTVAISPQRMSRANNELSAKLAEYEPSLLKCIQRFRVRNLQGLFIKTISSDLPSCNGILENSCTVRVGRLWTSIPDLEMAMAQAFYESISIYVGPRNWALAEDDLIRMVQLNPKHDQNKVERLAEGMDRQYGKLIRKELKEIHAGKRDWTTIPSDDTPVV